jgi:hypothetical protein
MNVTLKIRDDVLREARHRAVDQNLSLSAWTTQLILKELGVSKVPAGGSLLERLGDERLADQEIDLPSGRESLPDIEW